MSGVAVNVSLDALFRRSVSLHEGQCALRNRDGTSLTYKEVSNAVANVAEQIAAFGMAPKSAIALLLPNGRELVVALLAVMRCGHIPVPMPIAWRKSDLVRACREAEIVALITTADFRPERLPELAAEVAIEVFELSFPCAFGTPLPDGVLPLSLDAQYETLLATAALSDAPAVGIGTMQPTSGGVSFVLHSDDELLAAGLGSMLAGELQAGDSIVSAVSFASFAGLATALVPWLLNGGALTLLDDLPDKSSTVFDKNTHLIATSNLLPSLAALTDSAIASVFAIHFAGTRAATSFPALNSKVAVDVIVLGEAAVIALPRRERGAVAALPLGAIHAGSVGAAAPVIVETSIDNGHIRLRGAMVPKDMLRDQEWLDTDFAAHSVGGGAVYVSAAPELVATGGLRFNLFDLERRVRGSVLISDLFAVADPLLGLRLVIASDRPEETTQALLDAGLPRVVAASVRKTQALATKAG